MSEEAKKILSQEDLWRLRALEMEYRLVESEVARRSAESKLAQLEHEQRQRLAHMELDEYTGQLEATKKRYGDFFEEVQKRYEISDSKKAKIDWESGEITEV